MIDLIAEQLPRPDDKDVLVSILNFNYTTPMLPKFNGVEIEITNIHGQLGSEVVFGIDGKECMDEGLAVAVQLAAEGVPVERREGLQDGMPAAPRFLLKRSAL